MKLDKFMIGAALVASTLLAGCQGASKDITKEAAYTCLGVTKGANIALELRRNNKLTLVQIDAVTNALSIAQPICGDKLSQGKVTTQDLTDLLVAASSLKTVTGETNVPDNK